MTNSPQEPDQQGPGPETILPLQLDADSPRAVESSLLFVSDSEQHADHSGVPIEPATSGGVPYRYKVRFRGLNVYALTPDEVLGLVIDDPGYDLTPDRTYVELSDEEATTRATAQVTRRAQHCRSVLIDYAAQGIMSGTLDEGQIKTLQAASDVDTPPTYDTCPRWTAPLPLLLIGELYPVEARGHIPARIPPLGNVEYLHPADSRHYMTDLARLGYVNLQENPAYSSPPRVDVIAVDDPDDPDDGHGPV